MWLWYTVCERVYILPRNILANFALVSFYTFVSMSINLICVSVVCLRFKCVCVCGFYLFIYSILFIYFFPGVIINQSFIEQLVSTGAYTLPNMWCVCCCNSVLSIKRSSLSASVDLIHMVLGTLYKLYLYLCLCCMAKTCIALPGVTILYIVCLDLVYIRIYLVFYWCYKNIWLMR